jgi:drug/metabolite transporter (DMT)-like permease
MLREGGARAEGGRDGGDLEVGEGELDALMGQEEGRAGADGGRQAPGGAGGAGGREAGRRPAGGGEGAGTREESVLWSPGVLWALGYAVASIAITLFNKAVLSEYEFKFPLFLTMCQGAFTILALLVLKQARYLDFPEFNLQTAWQVAPLSLVSSFYIVVSLAALGDTNVPMFTALRRLTILFVMVGEYIYSSKVPSTEVKWSVVVMCVGALVAALKDLSFDWWGYFMVFLTNVATALYTVYIKVVKDRTKLSVAALLYYNTLVTLPLSAVLAVATGEFHQAVSHEALSDVGFQVSFFFSCTLAFFLNMSAYFSTAINSPTSQSVIGQLKNFVAFILSLVLFSDYIFEPWNFVGLLVGFLGGVWYTWIQYKEQASKADAERQLQNQPTPPATPSVPITRV